MNILILDDDELILLSLSGILKSIRPDDNISVFTNPLEARACLLKENIDVLFLDIEMPVLTGFELLDSLTNQPAVVIMSSSEKHAANSYNYDVIDYLPKPFNKARILKTLDKVEDTEKVAAAIVFLKDGHTYHKVLTSTIMFIEAKGDYVVFHIEGDRNIMPLMRLKQALALLSNSNFIRIHKSYVINLLFLKKVKDNLVFIGEHHFPIGRAYKDDFYTRIKG